MSYLNTFASSSLAQYALKVRKIADNSWWVYRYEIGRSGDLGLHSRVVFFGRSEAETEAWLKTQAEEARVYTLSDN